MSSEKLEREAFKETHSPCNQVCVWRGEGPKEYSEWWQNPRERRAGWISGMLGKKKRRQMDVFRLSHCKGALEAH